MSEFSCPLVRIGAIQKHPNADSLSITEVDGCPVVFKTIDFKEAQNQVATDQLVIAAKDQQIEARDTTIKDQGQEITALKGGSHWKRFWTATKHVAIGVAIGIAVDEAAKKK